MEVQKVMDLNALKPVKSEVIDLRQYNNRQVKIESAKIIQVRSDYTPLIEGSETEHIPQWVLKVESEAIASMGEGDEKIDFRASEFFNLVQDDKGNLKGYPDNERSNLTQFMKDIGAKSPDEIIGKSAIVKAYDKETETASGKRVRTFLKFKY